MGFANFHGNSERILQDQSRNPLPAPEPESIDWGSNFWGSVVKSIPAAGVESLRAISPALDAMTGKKEIQDDLTRISEKLTPDPLTTGFAGQQVHGLLKTVGKAIGYTALTGTPVGGAMLTGLDEGTNESLRLQDKGVDSSTANQAGAVRGLATGFSLALPVAGQTIAKTVGLAAAGGPASFMAEQYATGKILDHANYDDLAKQYDPFDATGLAVSMGAPLLFGSGVHLMRGRTSKANTRLVREAALANQVNPDVAQMIAGIETGGRFNHDAANKKSTAKGLFQFLDDTWTQYGGTDANRGDAATQADIGAKFIKANTEELTQALGRIPEPHEVYLSHLLGSKGAIRVLKADPSVSLLDVVENYDPKNAKAIVNNNGMKGLTVGEAVDKWRTMSGQHLPKGFGDTSLSADVPETPMLDPDLEAAIRLQQLSMHDQAQSLAPPGDIAGMNAHVDAMEQAKRQIDAGEAVSVADGLRVDPARLAEEQARIAESITAYHGTPFVFDSFNTENIGSGEGAQAFGHGLYFTDSKSIAEWYKNVLSREFNAENDVANYWIESAGGDREKALNNFREFAKEAGLKERDTAPLEHLISNEPGNLYQVELKPHPDEYLNWDEKIQDQSSIVKESLTKKGIDHSKTGEEIYKQLESELGSAKAASDELYSLGVKGMVYKANQGKSSSNNYVIFKNEDVHIKDRNGLGENKEPKPTTKPTDDEHDILAAHVVADKMPDMKIASGLTDENGFTVTDSAKSLLDQADSHIEQITKDSGAFSAAVNCFLRW